MKLRMFLLIFPIFLASLFLSVFAKNEETKNEPVSSGDYPSSKTLAGSLENIISKVQSIKSRIAKTLNETSSTKTRHDYLIEDGYKHTPGIGYHKLHVVKLSWQSALQLCYNDKAHLAVINSAAEKTALGEIVKEKLKSTSEADNIAYVGIHDYCKSGSWINIFFDVLDNLDYIQWQETSQKPTSGPHCAAINENGYLVDLPCLNRQAFFCEVKI